ncbi:MAG: hemin uptake protein HemP [Spongiibacteraceae bacterium]
MQEKNVEPMLESNSPPATHLSSHELFQKGNTVRIDHAGQTYWLRLTRGNKLILTK